MPIVYHTLYAAVLAFQPHGLKIAEVMALARQGRIVIESL